MEFHDLIIHIHGIVSTVFTLTALTILVRSIRGWSLNKAYTNLDKKISILFLVFLYIQLVLGILLYFVLGDNQSGAESMEEAMKQSSFRYWALEHFIIMIFALFLSQIGWVFIRKAKLDLNKHKNTLFYFGISILLIFISTGIGLIWR
ncbi:MAG: hypothetical protein CL661_02135 [Bacteroidetes bacterium]|nr:hypothetical protein [Bacteroidota bacterium]|tara:strand:+ start:1576 stop:2019 length:444 start_codon:yes stop_codon:yes gene_type:complete